VAIHSSAARSKLVLNRATGQIDAAKALQLADRQAVEIDRAKSTALGIRRKNRCSRSNRTTQRAGATGIRFFEGI